MKNLLYATMAKQKAAIGKTLSLSVLVYTLASLPPVFLGRFVDRTIEGGSVNYRLILIIIIVSCGSLGLERLCSYYLTAFSSTLITDRYMRSVKELLVKERKLFEQVKIGEIIDLFSRFITGYESVFTSFISSFAPSLLAVLILAGAIAFVAHIGVLGVVVAAQALLFYLLLYFLGRYAGALKQYTVSCYQLSDVWVEILGNTKVIQGEFSFAQALRRLDRSVSEMARRFVKKSLAQDMVGSFVNFGQTMALLVVIVVLVYYLRSARISIGSILTVITLNYILHAHVRTISDFLVKVRNFTTACADYKKIAQAAAYVIADGQPLDRIETICIAPTTIVKDDTAIVTIEKPFHMRRGEKICVLGLSGAGKTSFFSLLFNAHIDYRRFVTVNGVPASQINSEQYQRLVRISFQENELLSGQGYQEWFQRHVDPARAREILESLHLPRDIVTGARRLDPWSGNISAGEAKRLNIARLLMAPGDLNVLDEPTASLNGSLSQQTWAVIFDCLRERTVLCSTHDLTCAHHFNRVVIIDEGRIVADVAPEALENNVHFLRIRDKG